MTAQDLTTLGMHIINDFPEYYHHFLEKYFNFNNKSGQPKPAAPQHYPAL
jgi:D-alanyl-D-alanine carboxypeptidase (penicillin-binding protein 5/6)